MFSPKVGQAFIAVPPVFTSWTSVKLLYAVAGLHTVTRVTPKLVKACGVYGDLVFRRETADCVKYSLKILPSPKLLKEATIAASLAARSLLDSLDDSCQKLQVVTEPYDHGFPPEDDWRYRQEYVDWLDDPAALRDFLRSHGQVAAANWKIAPEERVAERLLAERRNEGAFGVGFFEQQRQYRCRPAGPKENRIAVLAPHGYWLSDLTGKRVTFFERKRQRNAQGHPLYV